MGLKAYRNRETIFYKEVAYHRYPDAEKRTHRTYYLGGAKWKISAKYLHRQMYEDAFGAIPKGYIVHHKDGNSNNNTIENLEILTNKEHMQLHMQESNRREQIRQTLERNRDKVKKAHKEYMKNRPAKSFTCAVCQKSFKSVVSFAKYCSKPCKWKIENQIQKEKRRFANFT